MYQHILKKDFSKYSLLAPLLEIPDCPIEMYILGNLPEKNENTKVLCVIGSRRASPYGKDATDYLLSGLKGQDIIVVSGLALGIDSAAHRAALKYGLKTLSCPGSGLDYSVLYPQSNTKLADEILEKDGALMSEYSPMTKSQLYTFPARNRIMAAISDLVLIVEAEEKSGTQITARLALDYNKDIAVVPGSIFSKLSTGTAKLYKDGAYPVTNSQDILDLLHINGEMQQQSLFENMNENEKIILKLLDYPLPKDELIEKSGLIASDAFVTLTMLESRGVIVDTFGEIRKLV